MADVTTAIVAAANRAVQSVIEDIAKAGLTALRNVLDQAGFRDSEYLKNYEVFAHVSGEVITFEILLDIEAVVPEDAATAEAIKAGMEEAEQVASTFGMTAEGPRRISGMADVRRDARKPPRDARRPLRDARSNARDRLIRKEVANVRPRSAKVDRTGRLSVALRRSVRETEDAVTFPQGLFQGILGQFMKQLQSEIRDKFVPEIASIIRRSLGG